LRSSHRHRGTVPSRGTGARPVVERGVEERGVEERGVEERPVEERGVGWAPWAPHGPPPRQRCRG